MPRTSALRAVPARGASPVNSPAAEALRRRLQSALPYGAQLRIADRLGRADRCVHAQVEGEHPLTVAVAVEAVTELPGPAALAALDELLAPAGLTAIPRPGGDPEPTGLLEANGALLAAVGAAEATLGAGLANGSLDELEVRQFVAALVAARARMDALLGRLGVGAVA